jgi:hypothetical protein
MGFFVASRFPVVADFCDNRVAVALADRVPALGASAALKAAKIPV